MTDNTSGRRWSRFALGFGAVTSILGNETHTLLTHSHLNIVIRMVLAFAPPFALFVAVEVLVRVDWRAKFIDYAGRVIMMIPVTVVAGIVSYRHIHSLAVIGQEDSTSALLYPLMIDGLMVGGAVALLAIRAAGLVTLPAPLELSASQPMDPTFDLTEFEEEFAKLDLTQPATWIETTTSAPVPVIAPRAPRARWDARRVCELALEGAKVSVATEQTGIGASTFPRYLKVAQILKDDPRAPIDPARKVPAEHVAILRELVTR